MWQRRKRSKYGVAIDAKGKEDRTADNITFDSIAEKNRYLELKMLLRSGIIFDLELQPRYPLVVNGVCICYIVPDFRYRSLEGKTVIEDSKTGVRTEIFKIKLKLFDALYKDLRITEV